LKISQYKFAISDKAAQRKIREMQAQRTMSPYMVFGSENMRAAETIFSKRSEDDLSGCLFEERSDELYPVGADRLFSRKPYQATSFSFGTFLFAMKKKSTTGSIPRL